MITEELGKQDSLHLSNSTVQLLLHDVDQRINDRGVAVDLELAHAAIDAVGREQARLKHEVQEATDGLDDIQLRELEARLAYLRELEDRRAAVLKSIEEQGKLTESLRLAFEAATTKQDLEDLYLPFKPKRRTKAMMAREAGATMAELVHKVRQVRVLVGDVRDCYAALGAVHADKKNRRAQHARNLVRTDKKRRVLRQKSGPVLLFAGQWRLVGNQSDDPRALAPFHHFHQKILHRNRVSTETRSRLQHEAVHSADAQRLVDCIHADAEFNAACEQQPFPVAVVRGQQHDRLFGLDPGREQFQIVIERFPETNARIKRNCHGINITTYGARILL